MAKNLNQIATGATSILATDKMYIARSPFGVTDDRYILGSDIIAQLDSPLTTKGDLFGFSTVDARLPVVVGDGKILQVSSAAGVGLAWSTPTYPSASGSAGKILISDSTNNIYSTPTYPNTGGTAGSIIISDGTNKINSTSLWPNTVGTALHILLSNGTTNIYSTPAYPNASVTAGKFIISDGTDYIASTSIMPNTVGTAGKIIRSDGTVNAYSASTFADTYLINTILFAGSANTIAGATLSSIIDAAIGSTQGNILYRNAANWTVLAPGVAGQFLQTGGPAANIAWASEGGTGTVTSFSAGTLSPLFTTSVANPTTTPALSFILTNAAANSYFGNATGGSAAPSYTAAGALTKTDDTNVTLTLGGAPTTALLTAASLTLGWTGVLSLARGGTNANLTASNGGIFYSTATAGAILSGTATAAQMLQSGSTAAPTWSTSTWPATTTANQLLYSSFNNTVAGLTSGNDGVLITSHTGVPSWLANGTAGFVLTANTNAPPSWQANGNGSVASVATGLGLTGGPITTTGTIAVTGVLADIVNNVIAPVKNLVIGGNFDTNPWQRGVSFLAASDYTADRFLWQSVGAGVVTVTKSADAPTVSEAGVFSSNCWHADVTTADAAIAAADCYFARYKMEGYDWAQIAQRIFTISFWVKSTITGIYGLSVGNNADRVYVAEYTVNASDTWEKKTVTIPASPSGGTWNYTTGIGLDIHWVVAVGTDNQGTVGSWNSNYLWGSPNQVNGMSSNSNNFKLALVQVEAGSEANGFQVRSEAEELALCQRYYEKTFEQGVAPIQNVGDGNGTIIYRCAIAGILSQGAQWNFAVVKRTDPTITTYNPKAAATTWNNNTAAAQSGAATPEAIGVRSIYITNAQAAGDLGGAVLNIHATATAEL